MSGMQPRDYSEYQSMGKASTPIWIFILIGVILLALPISVYFGYSIYERRKAKANQSSAPAAVHIDLEKQPSESTPGKWSLSLPGLNSQGVRRGSDGGFPPTTRHITFPDPAVSASVDSLVHKAPPNLKPVVSVISPVTGGYPTPPRVAAVRPNDRYHTQAHAY